MAKPNFFIIGAPKCGTTSLAAWLSQHPDVFIPPKKELNFFDDDLARPDRLTLKEYEKLFASTRARAIGEASVWYLYSRNAVRNILDYQPDARFIVCLRDPVDMAFSLHRQHLFTGKEDIVDFSSAWAAQDARKNGPWAKSYERSKLYYGDACKLGDQVQRLLAQSQAAHFVRLEDMKRDPRATFSAVLDFLNVPEFEADLAPRNEAKQRRSRSLRAVVQLLYRAKQVLRIRKGMGALTTLNRWNALATPWNPDPEFAAYLEDYFREDRELLAKLVAGTTTVV